MGRAVTAFAEEARVFCRWARGDDAVEMTLPESLRRVVALYASALALPHHWNDSPRSSGSDLPDPPMDAALKRFAELPLQFYWEIFDPITEAAQEPVAGHLSDDLGDIFREVARGLALFDAGRRDEALWEWGFNFQIHWGEHATGAIRAMHAYLSQEDPAGFANTIACGENP